ncbi:MAG: hypothetical protein L7S47_06630 [Acidimicrobiales bacterium]|jgi:hypothetical protein|nr:hypothetical protein [Acidimicrobiales bacterium]|tara:strand:- start:297 stop:617 length:321 start_codon:yes stop_codon:yes gene_type:complete
MESDSLPQDFVNLDEFAAPTALPSVRARILAFLAIMIASSCGGLLGFSLTSLQFKPENEMWLLFGGIIGSLLTAPGVAIVVVLVLRAMAEWSDQASARTRSARRKK